jgi:hypothetical protein
MLVTLDITKKPKNEAVEDIEKSINELSNRWVINRNTSENMNDGYSLSDMKDLHASLQRTKESIAYTTLRFYISADSEKQLEDKVSNLQDDLKVHGIKTFIPENEMLAEFKGLQCSADTVRQPMPVYGTLARQIPFYFQAFADSKGLVIGETLTGGLVILDTFMFNDNRTSFDMFISGLKGAGKTAFMCSLIQMQLSMGNKVMVSDLEGEMIKFAKKLEGKNVRICNAEEIVNVLQLRPMFSAKYEDDPTQATDEKSIIIANYTMEISRIICFFFQVNPDLTTAQAALLGEMLQLTYRNKKITAQTKLDALSPTDFPIFSDLLATIRDALYTPDDDGKQKYRVSLSPRKRDNLEELEDTVKPLAEDVYAYMFNGYTTVDISHEDFVVFDLSILNEMEPRIFNAYQYNILALEWSEMYKNRVSNEGVSEDEVRWIISVIPEAHRILNTKNLQGLEYMEKLERRARKYNGGLWYDTQRAQDCAPSGGTENLDKIKTIFELVQYKVLMKQDDSAFDVLGKLFPQFTQSEIESTSHFKKGELLISLGDGQKFRCRRYIPQEDFEYFGGGR